MEIEKLEDMFIDSQRKASAPTANRQGHSNLMSEGHHQFSQFDGMPLGDNTLTSRKEILTITVEIGNGQSANIVIRENDDPYDLATQFAQ